AGHAPRDGGGELLPAHDGPGSPFTHRTQFPFGQVRLRSVLSTVGQSPSRLRKNSKAIFPLEVRAFASIDPGRTIAGFRVFSAADKASRERSEEHTSELQS